MKKIYSYTKSLAVAAMALLTATACNESYEYVPDNETVGKAGQVYFDQALPSTIELGIEDSEFEIALTRANTDGEITVKLTSTQPEPAIYNVPENITFADGVADATLKITVNPDDLVYEDMRELTISVDDTYSTPYGINSYTVTVGVPAPWTPWCNNAADFEAAGGTAEWPLGEVGTGTYTFNALLSGSQEGVKVDFRQNKLTGECQFRLVELATSFFPKFTELVMDAYWMESQGMYALRIPMVETGYTNEGEAVYLFDGASIYQILVGQEIDWNNADQYSNPERISTYNPLTGLFSFNQVWYATAAGNGWRGDETLQMNGFYVPDYSISAVYRGIYTGIDGKVSAVASATLGKDATDVRAIVMPQAMNLQEIVDAMIAEESSEELPWVAVTGDGTFSVPFDPKAMDTEKLQIAMIAVVEGEAKNVTKVAFEYVAGEKPWKSLGMGLFTDDIMLTTYFNMDAPTYEVEILEHKDNPGLYRLVDPYAKDVHPYGAALEAQMGATMAPAGCYLEINAQDPSAVYINQQSLGCTINPSHGEIAFCTYPIYAIAMGAYDYETAKANGLFGTQENGIITFTKFNDGNGGTIQGMLFAGAEPLAYAGTTSGIEIVLPDAVTPEMSEACAKSRVMRSGLRRKAINTYDSKKLRLNPMVSYMAPQSFKN